MNRLLSRLDDRLHERVGILFKKERETDVHAVNVKVIFDHSALHKILACAGIANGGKSIGDEFRIYIHNDFLRFNYSFALLKPGAF